MPKINNLDKERECNNKKVEQSFNCALHQVTLDNNLHNIDSLASDSSHINTDDAVWLENNNMQNLDIQSDGRVDVVANKTKTLIDNILKEINVELAITSDENQE